MTTSPVVSVTDELVAELEAAANGASHWSLPASFQVAEEGVAPEEWCWHVGGVCEAGYQYPVMQIDTEQYGAHEDAELVARFYAKANVSTILALLAERAELLRDRERLEFLISDGAMVIDMETASSGFLYQLDWPEQGEHQMRWFWNPREAIDEALRAAMQEQPS